MVLTPLLSRSDAVLFPRALVDPIGVATPFLSDPPPKEESPPEQTTSIETAKLVAEASDKVRVSRNARHPLIFSLGIHELKGHTSIRTGQTSHQTHGFVQRILLQYDMDRWEPWKDDKPFDGKGFNVSRTPTRVPDSSANEGVPKDGTSVLPQLTSNALCVAQRVTIPLSSAIVIALISFLSVHSFVLYSPPLISSTLRGMHKICTSSGMNMAGGESYEG
jgi:hypothetical protein